MSTAAPEQPVRGQLLAPAPPPSACAPCTPEHADPRLLPNSSRHRMSPETSPPAALAAPLQNHVHRLGRAQAT
jgi:hypothetical protein